ncbi:MAG: hypothetical protein KF744_03345 [Taibaiella sp.]|nr:hypothetical protein [Taibaiella sp.]
MKKLIILVLLAVLAISCFAQETAEEKKRKSPSPTEANFNMPAEFVNIRDYAYLPNNAKMILELVNADQYKEIKDINETIFKLMQEISFYKDSLENGIGSVRIDYAVDEEYPFNKIRFARHTADGDIFMTRSNEVSHLKLDQDTVRFYVRHKPLKQQYGNGRRYPMYAYNFYQVTFCVNNYGDMAKIAADTTTLRHALDTLYATKQRGTLLNPHINPSSSRYNPYATQSDVKPRWASLSNVRFKQYSGLVTSDNARNWDAISRTDMLALDPNLGMGLVRNYLAPYAELGFALIRKNRRPYDGEYHQKKFGISISSYFLFERNAAGNYDMHPNNFVNLYMGEGKDISFGAGYLYWSSGNYFNGTTAKVFLNIKLLKKGLTLSPEVIATDNFNQFFPGLTLKVF